MIPVQCNRYLAARCLAELKDWEECMAMLDGVEALESELNQWLPSVRGCAATPELKAPYGSLGCRTDSGCIPG